MTVSETECVLGIDPGQSGALAFLYSDGTLEFCDMPVAASGVDAVGLRDILQSYNIRFAVVEKQQAMPKQGVASTFKTGRGYGILLGILTALFIPFEEATPATWRKGAGITVKAKDPKGSTYEWAAARWPGQDFKRTPRCKKWHDGRVDAAGIAAYAEETAPGG
jgi:crossover junction endodeoxyribonuclease RuvC